MQEYMDRITAALKRIDHSAPLLPVWRDSDNWSVRPGEIVVTVAQKKPYSYSEATLVICSVINSPYMPDGIVRMSPMVTLDYDGRGLTYIVNAPYVFKPGEILYLHEHRSYLEWLFTMSCGIILQGGKIENGRTAYAWCKIFRIFDEIEENGLVAALENCVTQQANIENDAEQKFRTAAQQETSVK